EILLTILILTLVVSLTSVLTRLSPVQIPLPLIRNTFNNFNSYVGSIINQRAYASVSCSDTTSFNPDCRWRFTGPAHIWSACGIQS
ncbi:hypothetical protein, partial [Escherichia coli]|uniref:hypothetical protein n=1 Tax=Escherichia coli TaxID=562 RepID=UPI001FCE80DD